MGGIFHLIIIFEESRETFFTKVLRFKQSRPNAHYSFAKSILLAIRKLNKESRALKLPSSVHEEGVGEVSLFADAKLHGYRQSLCS